MSLPTIFGVFASASFLILCGCSDDGGAARGSPDGGAEPEGGGPGKEGGAGGPEGGDAGVDGGAESCELAATLDAIVARYGSAWNEPDDAKRSCALEASLDVDVTYVDPTLDTASREDLAAGIGNFLAGAPASSIVQTSALDAREHDLRFTWDFRSGGVTVVKGVDYMELGAGGRITSIRGYWDPMPTDPPTGTLAGYGDALTATDADALAIALAEMASVDVRFIGEDGSPVSGIPAAAAAMVLPDGATVTVRGFQAYPKFARVAFDVESGGVTVSTTDYLHLDGSGRIAKIGRFEGEMAMLE